MSSFELFPLNKETLFEIYFVRLIGTPNQKIYYSKNGYGLMGCILVVQESLGSELSFRRV